jgi:hypothetical protein
MHALSTDSEQPSAFLIFNFQLSIFNSIWARPPQGGMENGELKMKNEELK